MLSCLVMPAFSRLPTLPGLCEKELYVGHFKLATETWRWKELRIANMLYPLAALSSDEVPTYAQACGVCVRVCQLCMHVAKSGKVYV